MYAHGCLTGYMERGNVSLQNVERGKCITLNDVERGNVSEKCGIVKETHKILKEEIDQNKMRIEDI